MESSLASPSTLPRVLLAEESLALRRLIREALVSFRGCEVDEARGAEPAFELGLRRPYQLLLLAVHLPDFSGVLLDRLLSKAYPAVHRQFHSAPPVIFLVRPEDKARNPDLAREARVRGVLTYPLKLDLLLSLTRGVLPDMLPPLPVPITFSSKDLLTKAIEPMVPEPLLPPLNPPLSPGLPSDVS